MFPEHSTRRVVWLVVAALVVSSVGSGVGIAAGVERGTSSGVGVERGSSVGSGTSGTRTVSALAGVDRVVCGGTGGRTAATRTGNDTAVTRTDSRPGWADERRDLTVARGDVAVVPLRVSANATITVRGPTGYTARLRVGDDGDGRIRLGIDTYLAGNRTAVVPGTYRAVGGNVSVIGGTTEPRFAPGEYTVTVRGPDGRRDRQTIRVEPPAVRNLTLFRAPSGVFTATDPATIRTAVNETGRSLSGSRIVVGETLVVRFDAPSLLGVVAAPDGADGLFPYDPNGSDGESDLLEIFGPCGGLSLDRTAETGGVRAVPDYEAGVVYLLIDTGRAAGLVAGGQTLTFDVPAESRLAASDRRFEREFTFDGPDRSVSVAVTDRSGDRVIRITGETKQLPGTRIPVRIESRLDPTVSIRTTATVRPNGTFAATVPVNGARGLYTVFVAGEAHLARTGDVPGFVWGVASSLGNGSIGPDLLPLDDDRRALRGNLLVAYVVDRRNGTYRYLGDSTEEGLFFRRAAEARDVVVAVHRDTDDDGRFDGPRVDPVVRVGGRPVADWFVTNPTGGSDGDPLPAPFSPETVVLPGFLQDTPTATPISTATPTPTLTPVEPWNETRSTTDRSDVTTPGFGVFVLAAALLALLALLAWRARDG